MRFPAGTTRRQWMAGAIAVAGAGSKARAGDDVSRTAESIHQEPVFRANPKRVYDVLTDAKQFSQVMQLSGAVRSGMALGDSRTEIGTQAGGPFTIYGGHIVGRQIELTPGRRIVQAWRVANWEPGVYSIAKFELMENGSGTKIVFDHTGFPVGQAEHLASGWTAN